MAYPCHGCGKMFSSAKMHVVSGYYFCIDCFHKWLENNRKQQNQNKEE